jgi:hypothetical protein
MISSLTLPEDDFEKKFWGTCANTYGEETKQLLYMREMQFPEITTWNNGGYGWNFFGRSVLDIGGGPTSVLLKAENLSRGLIVDPGKYPDWVIARYKHAQLDYDCIPGEEVSHAHGTFDLALLYNCLQHVFDPGLVVHQARRVARQLCMFEWIEIPPHEGHPHMLTASKLQEWTGQRGFVQEFHGEYGCVGKAWILRYL